MLLEIIEVEIVNYTSDGRGVCRHNGYPIFVPYTVKGDICKIKVTENKKTYFIGELIEVIKPSIHRIEPMCPHFMVCGGCDFLHIDYDTQIEIKKETIQNSISKIAKIDDVFVKDVIHGKNTAYRNKATYNFSKIDGKIVASFFKKKSNDVFDMNTCYIVSPIIDDIRKTVVQFCNKYNYVPKRLIVKYSFKNNEAMVALQTLDKKFMLKEPFLDELKKHSEIKSVIINFLSNDKDGFGKNSTLLYGENYINETLDGLVFKNYLKSFFQVNPEQTINLYNKAIDLLEITKDDSILDVYCGVGTISMLCAKSSKDVFGIEIVKDAITSANENKVINNISNVSFALADAKDMKKYVDTSKKYKVIVDPPRKGLDITVIKSICELNPEKISYISCDSQTMARDIKEFSKYGYKLIECYGVDMFCHSYHVETVALLSKTDK